MCSRPRLRQLALCTLLAAGVALTAHVVAPYWVVVTETSGTTAQSPMGVCVDHYQTDDGSRVFLLPRPTECSWYWGTITEHAPTLPAWTLACQALSAFGAVFTLVAMVMGIVAGCCCSYDRLLASSVGILAIISAALHATSIGVWAYFTAASAHAQAGVTYDWAYYVGIAAAPVQLAAGILFILSRPHDQCKKQPRTESTIGLAENMQQHNNQTDANNIVY